MKILTISLLAILMTLSSCDFILGDAAKKVKKEAKESKNPDGTTIKKKHFNGDPNSPVEWKVSVKVNDQGETVRHGESIRYSKTGKVYERINYVENKKEGKRYTYHSTGKVWKEQSYVNGKLDGICKRYDREGKITAEYNYKKGFPGVGLKEYTNLGKERAQPVLKVQKVDEVRTANRYKLKLSIGGENVKRYKSVEYYMGDLIEGKYFHKNMKNAKSISKTKGEFSFGVPKGHVLNKTFNIIAVAKNSDGLQLILQKKVSVSVRGI